MTYDACAPEQLARQPVALVESVRQSFPPGGLFAVCGGRSTWRRPSAPLRRGRNRCRLSRFLESSAADACLLTLDLAPMPGQAWIGFGSGLAFRVLDIVLGAAAGTAPAVRSAVTDIELHVLREFFDLTVEALGAAWRPYRHPLRGSPPPERRRDRARRRMRMPRAWSGTAPCSSPTRPKQFRAGDSSPGGASRGFAGLDRAQSGVRPRGPRAKTVWTRCAPPTFAWKRCWPDRACA